MAGLVRRNPDHAKSRTTNCAPAQRKSRSLAIAQMRLEDYGERPRERDDRRRPMTTIAVAEIDIALRRQPLMREFTSAQFDQLMRIAELVDFEPNEVIHRE